MKPLVFLLAFTAMISAETVGANHQAIRFSGRWSFQRPSEPWCAWQGSSFRVKFHGQGLAATLKSDRVEYVRVIVDQDHFNSRKLKLLPGSRSYPLAQDLDASSHVVEVVKETYSGNGRLYLQAVNVVDGHLLISPQAKPRLRLQFYGDSNLAGYSLEHERNQDGAEYCGCHFTFAGIASRMLGAEYQNISVSGATILSGQNSVLSFFNRVDYYAAEPKWKFDKFSADICVVNIGANDITRRGKQEILKHYTVLLKAIRQAHPTAHIVLMNGAGWDRREPANYTQEVVEELADDKLSRLIFPWIFNEWHGCEYDHAGMAVALVEHLAEINPSWKAVSEPDVMNGFAQEGNLANGGFESVAPFGGFGWRYFQDGAERVYSPQESPEGDWFLRIPTISEVHQPVPAAPDKTYRYKLWLRSPNKATAKIRVEFRDQQFRHEIQSAAKEFTFALTPKWTEHNVEVKSPPSSGNKTSDAWQIILRIGASEGTLECDDIQLERS